MVLTTTEVDILVSILAQTRKGEQLDTVIADFRRLEDQTRELEVLQSGPRDVYFLFKTDRIEPFAAFAKTLTTNYAFIKHDIEFTYDEGAYHDGRVDHGEMTFFDEFAYHAFEAGLSFLEHFTGIRRNLGHLLSVWADEVKPTPEQKQIRKEEMERGLKLRE